jgi:hypothetical protein
MWESSPDESFKFKKSSQEDTITYALTFTFQGQNALPMQYFIIIYYSMVVTLVLRKFIEGREGGGGGSMHGPLLLFHYSLG